MIDELGKDAVDRARRDACQVGKLGGSEALAACIAAGVVKVGDDPHADAGFLREVEERGMVSHSVACGTAFSA